jgi:hypothetical protein
MMLYDFSKMLSEAGIRAVPIDSGEFKSAGALGTPITPRQEEYFQGVVDGFFADFLKVIQRGRGMIAAAVKAAADGKMFLAGDALQLGLIDGISTFSQTLGRLAAGDSTFTPKSEPAMTAPATLQELRAACPGAPSEFLLAQLEAGATIDAAKTAFIADQQKRLTATSAKRPGVDALGSGRQKVAADGDGGDFTALVKEKMKEGLDRQAAVIAAARENPEAHAAFLHATNPQSRAVADAIDARFAR